MLLQVLPGQRRAVVCEPRVRHGLHFALAEEADALKVQPASADLFSAVAPRAVAKGGLQKALLPTASAGAYFAHKLGLPEGRRQKNPNSACDVQWLLQDRGIRDDYFKIFANALRRQTLLLPPAEVLRQRGDQGQGRRRVGHVVRLKLPRPSGASSNRLVPGSGWHCRRGRSCFAAAVTIDSIKRLQEQPGDGGAPCGRFFSRASNPLAVGLGQHDTICHGEHRPFIPSSVQTEWGQGLGRRWLHRR